MKTWKNLDEKETEITKLRWEIKNSMCYPVMTDMLPGPDSILKFIICNCKTSTDVALREKMHLSKKWIILCNGLRPMSRRRMFQ